MITCWGHSCSALQMKSYLCFLSPTDKQQKGEFAIDGYTVKMNNTLRKDGKKDCCFEIAAPDKRIYQVGLFYVVLKLN